jgi:hypothetical protein
MSTCNRSEVPIGMICIILNAGTSLMCVTQVQDDDLEHLFFELKNLGTL